MGQESLFGGDGDTAAALIPPKPTLRKVAEAAKGCRACDLWKSGTQTVFGEGRAKAELMLVGEQPGDQEDLAGRIHQKPNAAEIAACRPWLDAELALIKPEVLVCLGATAAQALLGREFRVSRDRGVPVESDLAPVVMATVHPSSILRSENREEETALLVEDLRRVAEALRSA